MVLERIKRSNFFLTKSGRYIDTREWHTVVTAAALAYISPLAYLIVTLKLFVEERRRHGSFAEYRQELPYWVVTGLIVIQIIEMSGHFSPLLGSLLDPDKILLATPTQFGG